MRPGVKGIALNSEQFASLADAANDISRAADDKDTSFDVNLGANKKATVREFKGSLYVDIREHYSKGDKLLPGKKGIMLPVGQWRVLEEHLPEVVKRMGV